MMIPNFPQSLCFQQHALFYASLGWRVFPLVPNSKRPATKRGFYDATNEESQIRRWWPAETEESQDRGHSERDKEDGPGGGKVGGRQVYNIGIRTGCSYRGVDGEGVGNTGLYVLDVDPRNGGQASVDGLTQRFGTLWQSSLHCVTGGGGTHYYYFSQKAISSWKGTLGKGIDLKGDGGYVVAPPSVNEHGGRYLWVGNGGSGGGSAGGAEGCGIVEGGSGRRCSGCVIAEVPASLQEILRKSRQEKAKKSSVGGLGEDQGRWGKGDVGYSLGYSVGAAERCGELVGVGAGDRNRMAASLAGKLWRQYGSRVIVVSLLSSWNEKNTPPLDQGELETVINSVSRYHK